MTTGWKLVPKCRERLLGTYPPRYPQVVADHVTLLANQHGGNQAEPPPAVTNARIVGRVDDGGGVEAMVVAIGGATTRPDGGTWHITWSLAEGRHAVESNHVIAALGWEPLDGGSIGLDPARW